MSVVRNTFLLSAVVSAPALVSPPVLYSEPNPGHREQLALRKLSQLAFAGRHLFARHCADCHGEDGRGTIAGPSLHHEVYKPENLSREAFHQAVTRGVKAQRWAFGDMPAVRQLSFNDIELIARYVREIQLPGRYQ
ncbi:MAG: cytochrome c [Paracoccaceae bacterium]